ncbi:hypothetical protein R0J87_18640, partial [Halomonas sp. SIMBA_159]
GVPQKVNRHVQGLCQNKGRGGSVRHPQQEPGRQHQRARKAIEGVPLEVRARLRLVREALLASATGRGGPDDRVVPGGHTRDILAHMLNPA